MKFPVVSSSCEAGHPLVYRLLSTDPTETGMRPTFKRLEVKDLGNLEKLVAENIEGIEPGLRVIDSRLVLGQAAIDLVALDARESLVLVALDFLADEGLLLRAMDAYSWCLEYPDALRRLYPMANVLPTRPPRILFIVERLTDAFVRRIKHLSFLEIDCLEFRHLEVNGASAVYFDLVERLRRTAPVEPLSDDERMIITTPVRTPKRIEAESPVVPPAWRPVAEPPAVQPSAWAPATADHARFVGPEPAPAVRNRDSRADRGRAARRPTGVAPLPRARSRASLGRGAGQQRLRSVPGSRTRAVRRRSRVGGPRARRLAGVAHGRALRRAVRRGDTVHG